MATTLRDRSAPALRWWVQRNPAYVLSAACIACGARMLLVPAEQPVAGDLAVILLTLGVLQAYEAGVTTIMLFLHRQRRAPEDQPSLLIVAAIFWTGPLIATMEMAALDRALGLSLALGAALLAIGELQALARYFHWRLAWSTHAVAAGFVLLVAIAQPMLKVEDAIGTNEMLLYGLWWLVGALLLVAVPGLRRAAASRVAVGVIAAAAGAAVLHLVAMNHAFFGHARLFYAAAPLAAASAAAMLVLRPGAQARGGWLLALCFWAPVWGIYISCARFDSAVSLASLPLPLRDPLLTGLALAAGTWGCGYWRHRWSPLLHAAMLASILAVERLICSGLLTGEMGTAPLSIEALTAAERGMILMSVAWYVGLVTAWRRARGGVACALVIHQLGVAALVPWSWHPSEFVLLLSWGWTVLLVVHVAVARSRLTTRLLPIAFLLIVSAAYTQQADLAGYAKAHVALIVVALAAAGWAMPWTHYRSLAVVIGVLAVTPQAVQWTSRTRHGPALAVTAAGFLLLAGGTAISWWKQALLARLTVEDAVTVGPGDDPPEAAPPAEQA